MNKEEWREVPRHDGVYEASNLGRVRSRTRIVHTVDGRNIRFNGRVLSPGKDKQGYLSLSLYEKGKQKRYGVHKLVFEAFNGLVPDGLQIDHIDNDKSNNHLENLRLVTPKENCHARVHRDKTQNNGRSKITHCPRGHPLQGDNLIPYSLKRGQRTCLACHRALSRIGHYPELRPMLQQISDSYFSKIMEDNC